MKHLHRPDLFSWAAFDSARDVDFNGHLWRHGAGNVVIDPMPLSDHDAAHIDSLGGVALILITNADHVRAAADVRARWSAVVAAPAAERDAPELVALGVDLWIEPEQVLDNGIVCVPMLGSKTPGELAFVLPPGDTVVCGDLVRGQRAGSLNLLPPPKITDRAAARRSVGRLASLPELMAVLVGDGQSVFHHGPVRLLALLENEA